MEYVSFPEVALMTRELRLRFPGLIPYITINCSGRVAFKVPDTIHWIWALEAVIEVLLTISGNLGASSPACGIENMAPSMVA